MSNSSGMSTREEILAAAREVFRHYGCAKTSMSDLARAAQLSRTALYNHFSNKDEVFRALAQSLYARFQEAAEKAAESPGAPLERLERVLKSKSIFHESLAGSRHGMELLDANHRLCGDLLSEANERFAALIEQVLKEGLVSNALNARGSTAAEVASTLVSAVEGISHADGNMVAPEVYEQEIERLMKLMSYGLVAR